MNTCLKLFSIGLDKSEHLGRSEEEKGLYDRASFEHAGCCAISWSEVGKKMRRIFFINNEGLQMCVGFLEK